tara:strand:- start:204 stop:383 length:180 start_codon:yes stop_codon:yes gene_type:complete
VYLTGVGRRQPQSGSAENSIPRSGNATALKQFLSGRLMSIQLFLSTVEQQAIEFRNAQA